VILPEYGAGSLPDLLPSVSSALGVSDAHAVIELPAAARYAVLLVDGLGLDQLTAHAQDAPYLASLLGADGSRQLTVGMPTTTATSLTSLGTGLPPGTRGSTPCSGSRTRPRSTGSRGVGWWRRRSANGPSPSRA
jgi:hypothetical protein